MALDYTRSFGERSYLLSTYICRESQRERERERESGVPKHLKQAYVAQDEAWEDARSALEIQPDDAKASGLVSRILGVRFFVFFVNGLGFRVLDLGSRGLGSRILELIFHL